MYCAICGKETEHHYCGTFRYSEPVEGGETQVVEEGLYECNVCGTLCLGPVQE
jgi:hypothetical protein